MEDNNCSSIGQYRTEKLYLIRSEAKMIFTEEILRQIIAFAIWKTSKSLGIVTDDDPALPDGVVELISLSTGHKGALDEFVAAYEAWYRFHLDIYKRGKSGQLSPSETQELSQLSARRDQARENLAAITN